MHATTAAARHTLRRLPSAAAWPQVLTTLSHLDLRLVLCVQPLTATAARAWRAAAPAAAPAAPQVLLPGQTLDSEAAVSTGGATGLMLPTPLEDAAKGEQQEVGYYGVVAQSAGRRRSSDGCYLVKTVKQLEGPGCHCMHFTLQRVEPHLPLMDQALRHWL